MEGACHCASMPASGSVLMRVRDYHDTHVACIVHRALVGLPSLP